MLFSTVQRTLFIKSTNYVKAVALVVLPFAFSVFSNIFLKQYERQNSTISPWHHLIYNANLFFYIGVLVLIFGHNSLYWIFTLYWIFP